METTIPKRAGRGRPRIQKLPIENEIEVVQCPGYGEVDPVVDNFNISDGVNILVPKPDAEAGASNAVECRRSSRKKCIKFDVREVLNKNRKPHKIQIEARIDSNAPKNTKNLSMPSYVYEEQNVVSCLPTHTNTTELTSKQKAFIEKSAIFRRFSISEQQHKTVPLETYSESSELPTVSHMSRAKEIFSASMKKSKQNCSLIVAQMESPTKSVYEERPETTKLLLNKRRGVAKMQKLSPAVIKTSAVAEGVVQPKKRGRPPKNKTQLAERNIKLSSEATILNSSCNTDDSIYTDLSSLDVTQSSSCLETSNIESAAASPQQIQVQNDIILEISSSSSVESTSVHFDSSKDFSDSKSRSFAAVSFLHEGLSMHNEHFTEPEFIVAAVEEIICDTVPQDRQIVETDQVEVDEPKPATQVRNDHKLSFRGTSGSESDTHSDCCSKSYKEGAELRVAVKRLFIPDINSIGRETINSCESNKKPIPIAEKHANMQATIVRPTECSQSIKEYSNDQPQQSIDNTSAEIEKHDYGTVPDCMLTTSQENQITSNLDEQKQIGNQFNVESDFEAMLETSVIINKNVHRVEHDKVNINETAVHCSDVSITKSSDFILPLKKQVKKFINFNSDSSAIMYDTALGESKSLTESGTNIDSRSPSKMDGRESSPVTSQMSELVQGKKPTWGTVSIYSDLQAENQSTTEFEQLNESNVVIDHIVTTDSQFEGQSSHDEVEVMQEVVADERYTDIADAEYIEEVQEYNESIRDEDVVAPQDTYNIESDRQYVMENYEINDDQMVEMAPECVQEEIVLASDQYQDIVSEVESRENESSFEPISHERLIEESVQEEPVEIPIELNEVTNQENEHIEHETCLQQTEEIVQEEQAIETSKVQLDSFNATARSPEETVTEIINETIQLPSVPNDQQKYEPSETDLHKDTNNTNEIPIVDAKIQEDVSKELKEITPPTEIDVQVKVPSRRGRKPKKKTQEVEESLTDIQNKAQVTVPDVPKNVDEDGQASNKLIAESVNPEDVMKIEKVKSVEAPPKVETSNTLLTEDEKPTSAISSQLEKTDTDLIRQSDYELSTREQVVLIGNIHQYFGEEEIMQNSTMKVKEDLVNPPQSYEDCAPSPSTEKSDVGFKVTQKVESSKKLRRRTESDDSVSLDKDSRKKRNKKNKKPATNSNGGCSKVEEITEKDSGKAKADSNDSAQQSDDKKVLQEKDVKIESENLKVEVKSPNQDCSTIPLPETKPPKGTPTPTDEVHDPLKDIAEFIEYGVSLLKRDYKSDEEGSSCPTPVEGEQAKVVDASNSATATPVSDKEESRPNDTPSVEHESLQTVVKPTNKSDSKAIVPLYETPADTPTVTPTATPPKSPIDEEQLYEEFTGVRRSHRIKKIHKTPRALVGRGVVESKANYNLDVHLTDLAEVEAKNAQFLKEMEQRLSNFQVIKENEYRCERMVSKEARKMLCDCFLTSDEEERGEMGCGEDCLNRLLMIECGQNCNVKDRCTNRRFQKFLYSPCRVFRTEKKGFGIMAESEVMPGEFIMEYVGEVIDGKEFEKRRNLYSIDKNRHYYFMALRSDTIIDATIKGNISRFINHSCDPNAETQKWTVNGELRIGFFSRKAIMPGEEITFDYQYQRYGREAQRCYCESANCRGWIGEEPNSEEGEQVEDDSEDDNLAEKLLNADDDDSDDDVDEEEAKRKLEMAAAEANLTDDEGLGSAVGSGEKSKLEEDPNTMFKKLLAKIAEKMAEKKKMNKQEKRRRRRGDNSPNELSPTKSRYLEDPDIDEDIDYLSHYGLKNQSDTLRFSRVMVRAELAQTRLDLLEVLRKAELPCRRLFLDYHGLRLLHGWMCKDTNDLDLRMAYLETLENLPITNRTILTDSKVYQIVRTWCGAPSNESGSPSDDSSKESSSNSQKDEKSNEDSEKSESQKLAIKLTTLWDNLPDNYRIPKRERIEKMKEHEREADRQYEAGLDDESQTIGAEGYQRDRFGRDMNSRYHKREYRDGRPITVMGGGQPTDPRKYLSKEQRRQMFAAQVAYDERLAFERRAYRDHCLYFGLDPQTTRPQDMPFMTNPQTGEWWSASDQLIATPPKFINDPISAKPQSTNPEDYEIPPSLAELPSNWRYAITAQGHVYYYHLEKRIPQWAPPTPEQVSNDEEEGSASEINEDEYSTEDEDEVLIGMDEEKFKTYVEKRVKMRKQQRLNNLVEERPISPRREEDRIYNQIEMRKYKENKEKIRKRKEEIRRRRAEALKKKATSTANKNSNENDDGSVAVEETSDTKTIDDAANDANEPSDALPIQDYLLSSDEDDFETECKDSALLDKIVEGDKIVDELDALTTKRALKRPLPTSSLRDVATEQSCSNESVSEVSVADKDRHESSKKRKLDKREKRDKRMKDAEMKNRKIKDKFRYDIAGIIVQHLKPYRKESCQMGRITNNDDFNHLIKKLTHFVMLKEMKYCASVGQTLVVNESVKNKSREFIKKYMAKYDKIYVRPASDPEFKDIPKITS